MRNKGFILVETLIASTIILAALIFLFIQFSSIKRSYDNSFKYNTITGIYSAKALANLFESYGYSSIEAELNKRTKGYIRVDSGLCIDKLNTTASALCSKIINNINSRQILFVGDNITTLQNDLKNKNYDIDVFDAGFRKFILAQEAIEYNNRNRLIIEYKNDTYAIIPIDNV